MKRFLCVLLICLCLFNDVSAESIHNYNDSSVITVGLYPYVNDYDLFCNLVSKMWQKENINLDFIYWEGDPEQLEGIDVIMYDAVYTSTLVENGWLMPLSLKDVDNNADIIPFAWQGAYYADTLYGIPGLLCAFFLMHDKNDDALAQADDLLEIYSVIKSPSKNGGDVSEKHDGLLLDFFSYINNLYIESWIDTVGQPLSPTDFLPVDDSSTLVNLHILTRMQNQHYSERFDENFSSIELFNAGLGRAYIGFSEHLDWMDDRADQLAIRLMPFSPYNNVPAFYTDVLSINANITNKEKIQHCKELINLIASKELMLRLMTGDADDPTYLLPARISVWDNLSARYPLYEKLYEHVNKEDACIIRFGPEFPRWTSEAYAHLMSIFEKTDK